MHYFHWNLISQRIGKKTVFKNFCYSLYGLIYGHGYTLLKRKDIVVATKFSFGWY